MRLTLALLAVLISLAGPGPALADKLAEAETAFANNRDPEAIALYGQAIAEAGSDPRAQAAAYFGRGEAHVWFGRTGPAVADFTAALALQPDAAARANILFSRGEALSGRRDFAAALGDYTEVVRLAPQMVGAHFARGRALAALGRKDEALAEYEAELRIVPTSYRSQAARADLLGLPRPALVHGPTTGKR